MRRAGSTAAEETPGGANTRHPWQLCTPALMHICNSCTHMPCLHSPRRMSHATSHAADAGTPQTACMHAATAAAVQNSTFPPAHAQHHGSIADLWVATARPPLHCKAPGSSPPPPSLRPGSCKMFILARQQGGGSTHQGQLLVLQSCCFQAPFTCTVLQKALPQTHACPATSRLLLQAPSSLHEHSMYRRPLARQAGGMHEAPYLMPASHQRPLLLPNHGRYRVWEDNPWH